MGKIRIGLIGLGNVARRTHLPILKLMDDVLVVAGVERNTFRRERVSKLFGLNKAYASYEEMYDKESLDAVYVCLPNSLHLDATMKSLERGLHVFCEKPVGMSSREAMQMTVKSKENNLVFMPGYKYRYCEHFQKGKKLIESGKLGKILQVQAQFMTPGPYISWDAKSDWYVEGKGGGVIYDIGCHTVDLCQFLLSDKIRTIFAKETKGFKGFSIPTSISCTLSFQSGATGTISFGWRTAVDWVGVQLYGTAGSVLISKKLFIYENAGTDPYDRIKSNITNAYGEFKSSIKKIIAVGKGKDVSFEDYQQTRLFVEAIKKKIELPIEGENAVETHKVLEAIIRSLSNSTEENVN
ncbi:MAG: Gfo/Idh/MocA family protein [Candidatus Hodarchaeota archaeon]